MARDLERADLVIYGAGGHGKVILDAVLRSGRYRVVGLLDDDVALHGKTVLGIPVLGGFSELDRRELRGCQLVLAVGPNSKRRELRERLRPLGFTFACLVHPSAQIGEGVSLGVGTVALAGVVINAETSVGEHVIVNTGATIDHDCRIGDFAHISPGVHLAGDVRVGALAHVGIGACVIPGITIGEGATVGAGAAVVEDVAPGKTVGGVPAREIREMRLS
jgi:sugar O-acyltransferase (sialic acid O-acetyltransferase NeuD family)